MASQERQVDSIELQEIEIEHLAELFKALSHPVRIRILRRLATSRRFCGDLVEQSGLAQSTVSHHLRILRDAGLIGVEEQGTRTCYFINRDQLQLMCSQITQMKNW